MANEIKRLYFGSQSSPVLSGNVEDGSYTLIGFGGLETSASINYNADAATVGGAIESGMASVGSGDVGVTAESDGFTIEFQGALADTDIGDFTPSSVSLKQLADGVDVSVLQSGYFGYNETQQLSLGGATTGTFDLYNPYNSLSATVNSLDSSGISAALDTILGGGYYSLTDLGGGNWSFEFISGLGSLDVPELTVSSNSTDGSPSVSTLANGYPGAQHIFTITLTGSPSEGSFRIHDSSAVQSTGDIAWNASAGTVESAIESSLTSSGLYGCYVSGSDGGPWTVTSDSPIVAPMLSGDDSGVTLPLRKDCSVEVVTVQEGSGGGGGSSTAAAIYYSMANPVVA